VSALNDLSALLENYSAIVFVMWNSKPPTPHAKISFAAKAPERKTANRFASMIKSMEIFPKFIRNIPSGRLTKSSGIMLNKSVSQKSFIKNFAANPKLASGRFGDCIFSMDDLLVGKLYNAQVKGGL